MTTVYQSKFWATSLRLGGTLGETDALDRSISNARVDLNPHQVDAALFAIRSPLSNGVILADEVGLGKTIEACLVLAQRWAERKRHILLIMPAGLRKQWSQELMEKFFLPSEVLESSSYKRAVQKKSKNPFDRKDTIIICSYQFAAAKKADIAAVPWDLVVIDEAHRLRNVYKPQNKTANAIKEAVEGRPKLMLTATPLQNTLLELYGLVSLIDEQTFGDKYSFRAEFTSKGIDEEERNEALKLRLMPLCKRTLRRDVQEYIRFTERHAQTEEFFASDAEHELYERVSAYLQRQTLWALPRAQRILMTLVLRKLLASSTFAIGATLKKLAARLERQNTEYSNPQAVLKALMDEENDSDAPLDPPVDEDFEIAVELKEEFEEEDGIETEEEVTLETVANWREEIGAELKEVIAQVELASKITENSKGSALLKALSTAFEKMASLGGPRKAVIFTESCETQRYLVRLLEGGGYKGEVILINGTNTDPLSAKIYGQWLTRHKGEPVVSGSKPVDIKAAIVEEFRDRATILVATEAAAEGVNLQFCSLVVNYDLPWNPQRVEQRIGRCHRYGQENDVVVVNFVNLRNAADKRVFDLLKTKFLLFDGVFGASDEILGAIESGVDIERRIAMVYQSCRTKEEIDKAFNEIQADLEEDIQKRRAKTQADVLSHFDEEVQSRLKLHKSDTENRLTKRAELLRAVTLFELKEAVKPFKDGMGFEYEKKRYYFDWRQADSNNAHFYRVDHPVAEAVLDKAIERSLSPGELTFNLDKYPGNISMLAEMKGHSGWMEVSRISVMSAKTGEQTDEELLLYAVSDSGVVMDPEMCEKLLLVPSTVSSKPLTKMIPESVLTAGRNSLMEKYIEEVEQRNAKYYDEKGEQLDRWTDSLRVTQKKALDELEEQVKALQKAERAAGTMPEKMQKRRERNALETKRDEAWKKYDLDKRELTRQKDLLMDETARKLELKTKTERMFAVRWTIA